MEAREPPRILLTGFSSFPGVPENPTEALIDALRNDAGLRGRAVHLATLAVEYRSLPARLETLGRQAEPDIALHFGVSRRAAAFTVETTARNLVCTVKADDAGFVPADATVRPGGDSLPSTLPAERIRTALARHGLPSAVSDNAGDYLCNFVFYLSCGRHCPPFAPLQAGFIHVPPLGTPLAGSGTPFDLSLLVQGAKVICAACEEAWVSDREKAARAFRAAS